MADDREHRADAHIGATIRSILLVVALLAASLYTKPPISLDGTDLPSLSTLKVVEATRIGDYVGVALEMSKQSGAGPGAVKDVLDVYRWGREQFPQAALCGPDYPPEQCQYGAVVIYLLVEDPGGEFPVPSGTSDAFVKVAVFLLERRQLDVLLGRPQSPQSLDELLQIHQKAAERTQGSYPPAAGAVVYESLQVFRGISQELKALGLTP